MPARAACDNHRFPGSDVSPQPVAPAPPGSEAVRSPAARGRTFDAGDLVSGRFRVVRFIARGGMGEVYEAEDLELGERIAIKTIREDIAEDERVNQRFRREVQLARKITHPNICRIFDLFQHQFAGPREGAPPVLFVTMELLSGETLAQRLKRDGPMTAEQARPIVAQMAAALSAAHAADIVHRDFKSSNVVLLPPARPWDPPRAVVTDFGLAYSVSDSTKGVTLSGSGDLLGTPDYMAPEQVEGGPVTPATDVYALGIVLYETVTGVRPFVGDTPIASALRRVAGPPAKPPRELAPNLPPAWDAAIMTCLARLPSRRFPDASFVLQALDPSGTHARVTPEIPRRLVIAALTVLAIAGVGIAWRVWNPFTASAPVAGTPDPDAGPVKGSTSRPAIAVLGFRNLANRQDAQWLSTALSEMVTTELGAGEAVRTVPGENVNRMKIELALADTDAYAPETLARIRENLGTDLVVFGSYVTVGDGDDASLRVDIRLQDSRQGQTLSVVSESGRAAELLDLVSRAGVRLRQQLGVNVDAVPARAGVGARVAALVVGCQAALRRGPGAAAPVRRARRARPSGAGRPGRCDVPARARGAGAHLVHAWLRRPRSRGGGARVPVVVRTRSRRAAAGGRHVSRDGHRVARGDRDLADAGQLLPRRHRARAAAGQRPDRVGRSPRRRRDHRSLPPAVSGGQGSAARAGGSGRRRDVV